MPPGRPLADNFFLPEASTSQYLIVFLMSTFQLQQFPRFQGIPNLRQGAQCPPVRPQRKLFCTTGEYVIMSNGVFNFNFLALLLSEILGGSQIYTRGPYAPWTPPSGEIFYPKRVLHNIIVFLISTFQLQQFPRFQGGPKFTLGGPVPPSTPPSGNFSIPEASTLLCLIAFLISTFQLFYFPRYQGGS